MRKLAAIMFSDMTGYTALMQQNEQLAKEKRRRLKDVLERTAAMHNGEVLQYYGDGALSIFNSAIDCIKCAIEIQQTLLMEPKVDLRIGLHTGDISMEDETIYGDGVNIASRIESLAVPGSVLISEKVYDEIKNQQNLSAREMGYFEFKNVIEPIKVFAVESSGLVVPARDELKGKTKQPANRLAVLPFVNMSADPENEYFSDGISEELLNVFSKVEGLQVTSRTSAFAFKGKNTDIRDIGLQLNVDRILEGSVRKSGNRVRITAQLINAADGYHIWSENFDRDLNDIFKVQDEISGIIVNKCRENLTVKEHGEKLVKAPVQNLEAYNLFLKGLHFYNKLTPGNFRKAIEFFEEAVTLEPDYAYAYAMAAEAYAFLGSTGQMQPDEAFGFVHKYADKALQLDNTLSAGYAAKGSAYLLYDWKWNEAHNSLKKAIELNPVATDAYQLMSFYYLISGKAGDAINVMEKALQVDPLSPIVNKSLVDAFLISGRADDALNQAEILLEMYPQMRAALELKGWCIGAKGDWKKAAEIFEEVRLTIDHPLKGFAPPGCAYAKSGEVNKAMECIAKIEEWQASEPGVVVDADLAMVWLSLSELDKGFYHLFRCVDKRIGPAAIIIEHPAFKVPHDDPRYLDLKQRMNLP
ncbi:MAG TPA: adenylate/guanylate cyclase domain-containing protein [Ignavibacteria bacterium]|nr:adenylate/guanylate cyclase domain-containing protein [Ignavibacteria bacterium]